MSSSTAQCGTMNSEATIAPARYNRLSSPSPDHPGLEELFCFEGAGSEAGGEGRAGRAGGLIPPARCNLVWAHVWEDSSRTKVRLGNHRILGSPTRLEQNWHCPRYSRWRCIANCLWKGRASGGCG